MAEAVGAKPFVLCLRALPFHMLARLRVWQSGDEATYILHPRFVQSHPEPPSACVGEVPALLKLLMEEQIQGLAQLDSSLPSHQAFLPAA
eukprot:2081922-Alexandrium_andersonii.AAC.1